MSIFISYSRKDAAFVRRLHEALAAQDRKTWVDWEGIPPSADWIREIEAAVDAAEAFVFVLSPDAAASPVCLRELAHAVAQNKRLLPLVWRDIDAAAAPAALARLNWVWFREQDHFDTAVATLLQAVDTDLDWVRLHTRLLVRAAEWDTKAQGASLALQGTELLAAEQWLALGSQKEPPPTALQTRYILQSRQQASTRRLRLLGAASLAAVVVAVLGTLFVFQRQATARQEAVAAARRLASVSERLREQPFLGQGGDGPLQISLQLAAEGLRRQISIGARSLEVDLALRRALRVMPIVVRIAPPAEQPGYDFEQVIFTPDRLAAVSQRPFIAHQWDARSLQTLPGRRGGREDQPQALSADGRFVATLHGGGHVRNVDVWATDTAAAPVRLAGNGDPVVGVALFTGGTHAVVTTGKFDNQRGWHGYSTALWRTHDSQVVAELPYLMLPSFSPDGRYLQGQVGQRQVVWDMVGLLAGNTTPRFDFGPAGRAEFSADGRHMLVVREGKADGVEVWRVDGWQKINELPNALEGLLAPGGNFMAVRDDGDNRLVRIFDLATRQERMRFFSSKPAPELAFSPDGQRIAVGGIKRIDVWRIPHAGGARASLAAQAAPAAVASTNAASAPTRISFSADGAQLMLFNTTGVQRWTPPEPQAAARRELPTQGAVLALPADGRHTVTAAAGQAVMTDTASGAVRATVAVQGVISTLALSPNGRFIALATADRRLHLARTEDAQVLASVALPGEALVVGMAVAADGEQVVALLQHKVSRVGQKLELAVWRRNATPALAPLMIDKHGGLAAAVCALGTGGTYVAINNTETSVQVRHTRSGEDVLTADEAGGNQRCAFSPDERYLAITGAADSVRVWDVVSRAEIARIEGLADVVDMAFTADGQTLATLRHDGAVQTWALRDEDLLDQACARLSSNLSAEHWARYVGGAREAPACPALPVP